MIKEFEKWLMTCTDTKKGHRLSDSTAYKYSRAIKTISKDMLECGVINVDLLNIKDRLELSKVILKIKDTDDFVTKNERGNKMYSNALDYYLEFVKYLNTGEL